MAQASGWEPGGRTVNLPTRQRQRRGVLAPVIGLVALGICGLVVLGLVGSSIGVAGVVVGALCALLPVGPVVATFLWVDRWEPEPPRLLLLAFLWGACFAALSALLINSSASLVVDQLLGRGRGDLIGTVAVAPVVEEALKGAFLVGMLIFRRREFDGIVDGIVYAGLVAAGFAFTENILYLGQAFTSGGSEALTATFIVRCIMGPFGHPLFTACIGIGLGIAVSSRHRVTRVLAIVVGWACAVVLHGVWNLSALAGNEGFFAAYATFQVPLFVAFIGFIVWLRRREGRLIGRYLSPYADAGWLTHAEVLMLSHLRTRRAARVWARQHGGPVAKASMAAFQDSASDLALLRSRLVHGTAAPDAQHHELELLHAITEHRRAFVGSAVT
jgi:protease PrsW